ncbi:MAG: hypothetical protein Q9M13_02405 [Mariprofundales bacterium]|nr:hypothetical protein [Mariprofundales bacterium]
MYDAPSTALIGIGCRSLLRSLLLLVVVTLLLGGCENEYSSSHQLDGDKLVKQLHQAIMHREWDSLNKLYSAAYLEQNSSQMIAERWQRLISRYGELKGFELHNKIKDARLQGEFYMYSYAVLFAHGRVSETITVYVSGQNGSITISGHRLTEEE